MKDKRGTEGGLQTEVTDVPSQGGGQGAVGSEAGGLGMKSGARRTKRDMTSQSRVGLEEGLRMPHLGL